MSRERILAADDDQRILDILTFFLTEKGYEVAACSSPQAALEAYEKNQYDLLILDVVMPGKTGYRTLKEIRERTGGPVPPVLLTSAKVEVPEIFLDNYDGKADFLQKPFRKETLIRKVTSMIGQKENTGTSE